jgi:betaine lipid synthase
LLELKLASITSLEFEDFWKMFGDGRHPQFETLLHDVISPNLSSHALQYWSHNSDRFSHKFYKTGYSVLALSLVEWWIKMQGLQKAVYEMCHAETIEEQQRIWNEKIRPAIFSPMIRKVLNNPMFMWNALGGNYHFTIGYKVVTIANIKSSSNESDEHVLEGWNYSAIY